MLPRAQTIKQFARDHFVKVNFIDIYGRSVGLDYNFILASIKARYPNARTSRRWLQDMAYLLQRTEKMPDRRRLNKNLVDAYTMTVLRVEPGISFSAARKRVRRKFPDHVPNYEALRRLERKLRRLGFTVPARP